jgi:CubicO group peptidase (beta-lactamase class C family)
MKLTRRRAIEGSLASLAGGAALAAPTLISAQSPDLKAIAERHMKREIDAGNVPGIGWSIGNTKETLAEGAVGLRVVSPAIPVDPSTRFAIASVSKQFTAVCVYMLHEQGALSLDAPLSTYLPEYRLADKVTLRQMLRMSSGLPSDMDVCEAAVGERMDEKTLVEKLNSLELESKPGEHFHYNNCAYDLAGAVVVKVSGMSFARFIDERICKPLGMTVTYQLGTSTDPDFAEGYARDDKGGWKPEPLTRGDKIFASGNLASNPSDIQRWNRAMLNATLLSRKSMTEIFTVAPLSSGAKAIYGSGWFIEPNGVIWHGGTLYGYGAANVLIPVTGHAFALLGNTAPRTLWNPWEVARAIYNEAKLGPPLSDFAPIIGSTLPGKG